MTESQHPQAADPFIASLIRFAPQSPQDDGNRAALAALRRGLGRPPGTVPEMYRFITPYAGATEWREREDAMFIVGSLFGLYPRHSASAGSPLKALRSLDINRASIEKRVLALLNAGQEEIPTHLRHVVHLLASSDRQPAINYETLLRQLRSWDHPDRWVQRNWARDWWAQYRPSDDDAGTTGEEGDATVDEA
jgi:CRISPR system Cascade subunit CasB